MKKNTTLAGRNAKQQRKAYAKLIREFREFRLQYTDPEMRYVDHRVIRIAQQMAGFRVTGR